MRISFDFSSFLLLSSFSLQCVVENFIAGWKSFRTIARSVDKIGRERFMVDVEVLIADEADFLRRFEEKEFLFKE